MLSVFIIVGLSLEVTVNGYVPKYVAVREQLAMTQDELWMNKWKEAIDFLETNHRRPSKFVPEERDMRNWWKHNKKL